jgi:hypothetical protein
MELDLCPSSSDDAVGALEGIGRSLDWRWASNEFHRRAGVRVERAE